jgi:DNA-binding CsgD family transcriptional regulator
MPLEQMVLQVEEHLASYPTTLDSSLPVKCVPSVCRTREQVVELCRDVSPESPLLHLKIELAEIAESLRSPAGCSVAVVEARLSRNRTEDRCSAVESAEFQQPQILHEQRFQGVVTEFQRLIRDIRAKGQLQEFRHHLQELSPRQLEVLSLLIQGRTSKEVAARLKISLTMATKHRARLFRKLCVRNIIELAFLINTIFEYEHLVYTQRVD